MSTPLSYSSIAYNEEQHKKFENRTRSDPYWKSVRQAMIETVHRGYIYVIDGE